MKRSIAPFEFPKVLAAVVTYLPNTGGYFAHRYEVIKVCLESMRRNAEPHDLAVMVWDNGSCIELTRWLEEDYKPDFLMLSPNIGKTSALACILHMLPAQTLVAYSDDDMLFYPHWLSAHLEIYEAFPNVGMVSGYPVRVSARWGTNSALAWAQANAEVHLGKFISDEWENDYSISVGIEPQQHLNRLGDMPTQQIIKHGDLWAFPWAQHCQFLCKAGAVAKFRTWNREAMKSEREFDETVDAAGLLRLTTKQRYTRHMGNVVDDDLRFELRRMYLV